MDDWTLIVSRVTIVALSMKSMKPAMTLTTAGSGESGVRVGRSGGGCDSRVRLLRILDL